MTPQIYPCQGTDPEVFFDPEMVEQAKAICAGCWFRTECLRQAKARGEEYGVWGGVLFRPVSLSVVLSEREKIIIETVRQGHSQGETARRVGVPRSTVASIIRRKAPELCGIRKPSRHDDILALWESGVRKATAIARELGIHERTAQKVLREYGCTKEAA